MANPKITVVIPPGNPVQFAELDLTTSNSYNYPAFGQALQEYTLRPEQIAAPYMVPFQYDDLVVLHVHRSYVNDGTEEVSLHITDECGNNLVYLDVTHADYRYLPGFSTESGEPLFSFHFQFKFGEFPALADVPVVRIQLHFTWASGTQSREFISERISLAQKHEDTVLIQASHSANYPQKYTLFALYDYFSFFYRIPSYGLTYDPAGENTVSVDQNSELVKLDSTTYKLFKLDIGGSTGVSTYTIEILNNGFCFDRLAADGMKVSREENAKLELVGDDSTALQFRTLLLRSADPSDSYVFALNRRTFLWKRPGSYPYAISGYRLTDGLNYVSHGVTFIENEAGETAFIAAQNGRPDITGTFEVDGDGNFYYVNGTYENYRGFVEAVCDVVLTMTLNIASLAGPYTYAQWEDGQSITDWGDGSGQMNLTTGMVTTIQHTYAATGGYTFRIFSDGTGMRQLNITNPVNRITTISGAISSNITTLLIREQNFSGLGSLDLAFIRRAQAKLALLNLASSQINAITPGWVSFMNKPFKLLKTIRVDFNNINSADISNFFLEFYVIAGWTYNGQIYMKQTPAAVPTGPALAAIAAMQGPSNNWMISHD